MRKKRKESNFSLCNFQTKDLSVNKAVNLGKYEQVIYGTWGLSYLQSPFFPLGKKKGRDEKIMYQLTLLKFTVFET